MAWRILGPAKIIREEVHVRRSFMDRHGGKAPHRALFSRHRDLQSDESEDQGSHRSHGSCAHSVPRGRVLDRYRAAVQRLCAASCRLARRNRLLLPHPVHASGHRDLPSFLEHAGRGEAQPEPDHPPRQHRHPRRAAPAPRKRALTGLPMSDAGMTPGSELSGKVALVTGGARNIGRAISRSLAAGGATVMVNANTSQGDAKNTVAMIKSNGGTAAFHFADVTDPAAVAKMVDATVKQFGRLDILVNNAAVRSETPFEDIKLEEWRRVIATVLDGAFLCTQSCLPHLIRVRGGAIVNIGGLTAHKGATGRAHVITAKAGIAGMTRALALDLAPRRITVNCVVPGTIETVRGLPGAPLRPRDRRGLPPIGRRGEPEEVAAVVRMLCGPDARYITGQTVHVNGGGFMP